MLAKNFLIASAFVLFAAIMFLWYYCSLIMSVSASGKSKDGSRFSYIGTLRVPLNCDMLEYDGLRMKAMINDGTWTLSPFAIKYGIDPKAGIYYEYGVTEKAMIWFPLQWRVLSPDLEFRPSFVMKYNANSEYRASIDRMPREIVLNAFHNDVDLP